MNSLVRIGIGPNWAINRYKQVETWIEQSSRNRNRTRLGFGNSYKQLQTDINRYKQVETWIKESSPSSDAEIGRCSVSYKLHISYTEKKPDKTGFFFWGFFLFLKYKGIHGVANAINSHLLLAAGALDSMTTLSIAISFSDFNSSSETKAMPFGRFRQQMVYLRLNNKCKWWWPLENKFHHSFKLNGITQSSDKTSPSQIIQWNIHLHSSTSLHHSLTFQFNFQSKCHHSKVWKLLARISC